MRINHLFYRSFFALLLFVACGLFSSAGAQSPSGNPAPQERKPTVILPEEKGPPPVATKTNLYCAGFIQYGFQPIKQQIQIVGGEEEQEQRVYSQGDYVYIDAGAQKGVRVGQEYSVIRPRGQFRSSLSKKKDWLGIYVQEVGFLRVLVVKEQVSLAMVISSCDNLLLGDLLRPASRRIAPVSRLESQPIDRFADPTGKQKGRIILARDAREVLSRDQVVFIDLGQEDNVKPGDYLTIYRPLGKGNITDFRDDEVTPAASGGFESDTFKGGKFSNKVQRVEDPNFNGVYGPTASTPEIKGKRPPMPRKIVGEMVILSIERRTAAAVITRAAQEVHTGDYVEVQ